MYLYLLTLFCLCNMFKPFAFTFSHFYPYLSGPVCLRWYPVEAHASVVGEGHRRHDRAGRSTRGGDTQKSLRQIHRKLNICKYTDLSANIYSILKGHNIIKPSDALKLDICKNRAIRCLFLDGPIFSLPLK